MYREELSKALMSFFFGTTVSSAIIETLAESQTPMGVAHILAGVRDIRRIQLPQSAVESSLMLLEDAGLVTRAEDSYKLTRLGAELSAELSELRRPPGR
jgi:predicted transcriptional regulator